MEPKDGVEKTEDGTGIWCEVRLPMPRRSSEEIEELFKTRKLQFDLIVTPWGYRYLSMSLKTEVKE